MGLYDTIICDLSLPELDLEGCEFQTKSLDKFDEAYRIDMFGQLYKVGEQPNYLEFIPHTGSVNFYRVDNGIWLEYEVEFADGKCGNVKLVEKRILERDAHRDRLRVAWANGTLEK